MKNNLFRKCISLAFLVVLLSSFQVYASVTWDNTMAPDVIDDDLTIDGSGGAIDLVGKTIVNANTVNVNVTVTNSGTVTVEGDNTGPSQLYLCAASGKKITFNLDTDDLIFLGSDDANKTPLLIIVGGAGTVEFKMKGGRTVSFTSDATHGGTEMYVLMDAASPPTLKFLRDTSGNPDQNITTCVGKDSLISYLATMAVPAGTQTGTVQFDAVNTDPDGRMILSIKDKGGVVIAGHFVANVGKTNITLGDIDRTKAAGKNALFKVYSTASVSASLLVENKNNTLFDLLFDPFCNLKTRDDLTDFNGSFDGIRYGFVLGANGTLDISNNAYLDYVGLTCDLCPSITAVPGFEDICSTKLIKERNPSAFFVDGNNNPQATSAKIDLGVCSAIFFRSGVNDDGVVENDINATFSYTIDPANITEDEGKIVFDVEGEVNICGQGATTSKLEILSLFVQHTGCKLFVDGTCPTIFPKRTFAKDGDGDLRIYNSAAFLINNCMNLKDTTLMHTDENHDVFQKNDVKSEPAYIGGETHTLKDDVGRPKISFCNSRLLVHTDIAFAGVDLLVPPCVTTCCEDNVSRFIFFHSGKKCDQGTGRTMILGTQPGSMACDGCSIISRDAHLDVQQREDCCNANAGDLKHKLHLEVDANSNKIIDPAKCSIDRAAIANQFSIHTIFLGHASNISIGTHPIDGVPSFTNKTCPMLKILGNCFSFETRGGTKGLPEFSNVTGEGGIFVDEKGTLCIGLNFRANMSVMVTKSGNGIVNLPKNQVFFDCRIGIAEWQLDLSETQTIVTAGQCLSDYTLNWIATKKDFEGGFCPYEVLSTNSCDCPPVEAKNILNIPTVVGQVGQLQIQGSRICDQAHVKIDCGWVRELVFQKGSYSAQAPTGVVVLQRNGRLGLGTAHRNPDSLEASVVLGVNGVTIIANGDGLVELNEDVCINNVCSILKGPDFKAGDKLQFNSDCCRTIRVKPTGILDLRSFGEGDTIEFNGNIKLILEPGAQILLNGVTVRFADTACMIAEPFVKAQQTFDAIAHGAHNGALSPITQTPLGNPHNQFAPLTSADSTPKNTDDFRVKIIGIGTFIWADCSCAIIERDAFVGIETLSETRKDACEQEDDQICKIDKTDIKFLLKGCSLFLIGDCEERSSGSLQIGNTENRTGHEVSFNLCLQGKGARFRIKQQGFFGLGVGIVDKGSSKPNDWLVDNLYNVKKITIQLDDGEFVHDRIYSGDDDRASLMAISQDTGIQYDLLFEEEATDLDTITERRLRCANMCGGGNMVVIVQGTGALHPIVTDDDDEITVSVGQNHPRMRAGILASSIWQKNNDLTSIAGNALFNALKLPNLAEINDQTTTGADFASGDKTFRSARTGGRVGLIDRDKIGRFDAWDVIGAGGRGTLGGGTPESRRARAEDICAVFATVDQTVAAPGRLLVISQVQ